MLRLKYEEDGRYTWRLTAGTWKAIVKEKWRPKPQTLDEEQSGKSCRWPLPHGSWDKVNGG
jgi:hypothetical protein